MGKMRIWEGREGYGEGLQKTTGANACNQESRMYVERKWPIHDSVITYVSRFGTISMAFAKGRMILKFSCQ